MTSENGAVQEAMNEPFYLATAHDELLQKLLYLRDILQTWSSRPWGHGISHINVDIWA